MNKKGYYDIRGSIIIAMLILAPIIAMFMIQNVDIIKLPKNATIVYDYLEEYNALQDKYTLLEEQNKNLLEQKQTICECKQGIGNIFLIIIGLMVGFIGSLYMFLFVDKKKILDDLKRTKK